MSTKRTPLGGGKYCYSGPNCRLHSATGTAAARELRDEAVQLHKSATTLGEMTRAQEALEKASIAYDATEEGLAALQVQVASASDPLTQVGLRRRILAAQSYADAVEQEAQYKARLAETNPEKVGLVEKITLSPDAKWEEWEKKNKVGIEKIEDSFASNPWAGLQSQGIYGGKAAKAGFMTLLKQAQKDGHLPKNLKYSVTVPYAGAGGSGSLYVEVQGLADSAIGVKNEDGYVDRQDEHPEAKKLQERLQSIANTFTYDRSNSQVDYFQHGVYMHVKLESEYSRKHRFAAAAERKVVAETKVVAKEVQELVKKNGNDQSVLLTKSQKLPVSGRLGEQVYQYGNSRLFVVTDEDANVRGVYNLSAFSARSEDDSQTPETVLGDALLTALTRGDQYTRRNMNRRRVEV